MMHVGEKPYVVTASSSMNAYRGPLAWGQVELSSRVLTFDAVSSMLGQILPADQQLALTEFGAIEHEIPSPAGNSDRFTVVAARGGEDVWVEVRRRPIEVPTLQVTAEELAAAFRPSKFPRQNRFPYQSRSPRQSLPLPPEPTGSARDGDRSRGRNRPAGDRGHRQRRRRVSSRRRHPRFERVDRGRDSRAGRRGIHAQWRCRQRDSGHRRRAARRTDGRGSRRDARRELGDDHHARHGRGRCRRDRAVGRADHARHRRSVRGRDRA